MAKASNKTTKRPPAGEMMDPKVLSDRNQQLVLTPFAGDPNPTAVWYEMITDSVRAFTYYRDNEEKDDQIAQCLETRKNGVLSRERQIVPASKDSQDAQVAEFVEEVLAGIPNFGNILNELLDAPPHGVAIAETIWQSDGSRIIVENIKPRPPEWFLFNPVTQIQNGPLRLKKNIWDVDGEAIDEELHKFIVYTFRARFGNRRGRPLLRRLFWPSWIKRQTLKFWLKYAEKGPGTIAVRYRAGADNSEQTNALKAAEDIAGKVAVAFPEGFEIMEPLLKAARSVPSDIFKSLVKETCDAAIAKIILGQTLTSQGSESGRGSQALGTVHQDVRLEIVAADAHDLMTVINDQVIRPLVDFNFGPETAAPKWTIQVNEPENLAERSKVDQTAQQMGMPITEQYMRKTYNYPQPEPEDQVLEARQALSLRPGNQFSERDRRDAAADMAKLEAGAKEKALTAYAALVKQAVTAATAEFGK
ncbi:MAG TPA: DUF935 family protein [Hyphomicrobiaceae bacterium]|nr:DUF935 family protein [Hyphomicrobiaceae bacterium]